MHKARTGHKTEFMSKPERAGISIGTPATEGNWFLAKTPGKNVIRPHLSRLKI